MEETKAMWVNCLTEVIHINMKEDTEKEREEMLKRPLQKHARNKHRIKIT